MDTELIAKRVGELLLERRLTLGLAESCTGGTVASYITDVPGSSAYFEGGIVAYSYQAKMRLLGVSAPTLERYGAVSAEVAVEMALGARARLGVDLSVSVTGIAGPGGATLDKPVGLTYIGLASAAGETWRRHFWNGKRRENRELSARAALQLLQEYLESRVL